VEYFDVLDGDKLLEKAPEQERIVINHVSPTGDLSIIPDQSFDVVFSAHCIEHQPDLISHLQHVARILRPRGSYLIVAPDRRYCFDHFIEASTIEEVQLAHHERRKLHSLETIILQARMKTHNDSRRHWKGDHGKPQNKLLSSEEQIKISDLLNAGRYIDCHAWRFEPSTFQGIVQNLINDRIIPFSKVFTSKTRRNRLEFSAVLES
jgi:predicted SAM-dependent methyltransferase